MKKMNLTFPLFLIIILLSNCSQEKMQVYPVDFDSIVNEFFVQANLRGDDMQLEDYDFTIRFDEIKEDNVIGQCRFRDNRILIDSNYWNKSDDELREWLVFHELGHCLLDRGHRNEKNEKEACLSYMRGAREDIKCSFNFYSTLWRDYYLDELFDDKSELPDWYFDNQVYEFAETETLFEFKDLLDERMEIDTIDLEQYENFLIEFKFENLNTEQNLTQLHLGGIVLKNCDKCQVGKIELTNSTREKQFYRNDDLQFNADIKLTMIRNRDIISFFVNETFIHAMEYELLNGSEFQTNSFREPVIVSGKILVK